MSFETKLEKYARLIVQSGLNVQEKQTVVISASIESYQLVREVTKQAYLVGAKEVVVNTILILFGNLNSGIAVVFTVVTAYTFLVFCALYTPCIATLATMRKEYGNKMMLASLLYQFGVAWIVGFVVNFVGSLIVFGTTGVTILQFASFIIVVILTAIFLNYYSKNNKLKSVHCDCSSCPSKCNNI